MSLAKVIEVIAEGATLEEAVENAVTEAGKTVRGIESVYVRDFRAAVDGGKVVSYRANCKVTFVVGS